MLLAAGGVDYCRGLGGWGWTQDSFIARATSAKPHTPVIFDATFHINVLGKYLKTHRKSRRRENDPDALAAEIDNIIYCWRYYMWVDAERTPKAGPTLKRIAPRYAGVKTVSQWIDRAVADPVKTLKL